MAASSARGRSRGRGWEVHVVLRVVVHGRGWRGRVRVQVHRRMVLVVDEVVWARGPTRRRWRNGTWCLGRACRRRWVAAGPVKRRRRCTIIRVVLVRLSLFFVYWCHHVSSENLSQSSQRAVGYIRLRSRSRDRLARSRSLSRSPRSRSRSRDFLSRESSRSRLRLRFRLWLLLWLRLLSRDLSSRSLLFWRSWYFLMPIAAAPVPMTPAATSRIRLRLLFFLTSGSSEAEEERWRWRRRCFRASAAAAAAGS